VKDKPDRPPYLLTLAFFLALLALSLALASAAPTNPEAPIKNTATSQEKQT
jgi:hypothetical protein